jgi:hypothetical protein
MFFSHATAAWLINHVHLATGLDGHSLATSLDGVRLAEDVGERLADVQILTRIARYLD